MADNPVAGGHNWDWRRVEDGELFDELCELCSRIDAIPDAVLEVARAAGPPPPEGRDVGDLAARLMPVEPLRCGTGSG